MEQHDLNENAYISSRYNTDDYVWIITDYITGDYYGDGEALGLRKDGKYDIWNLGHCSCYGPFEEGPVNTVSHEALFGDLVTLCCEVGPEVLAKAKELLGIV